MQQFTIMNWLVDWLGLPKSWAQPYLHIPMAVAVLMIITVMSAMAWRRFRHTEACLIPEGRTSLANILEVIVSAVLGMMEDLMGQSARKHLPVIGAVFIYILVCNLVGVIPGLAPPTENVNTNLACALVVFFYYNYVGIRTHGLRRYLKHMAGPIIWLTPLVFAIELVSHLMRPISLSVRLFGNIMGDHMVLGMFSNIVPIFVPTIFMILTIFISFIQAFVFTLLSIIYISLATGGEDL